MDRPLARVRRRTSGADRPCRPDQSRHAAALRAALRRTGLRPGARTPGRAAAAAVRHVGARWLGARAGAGARRQAPRRDRTAFLFLRRPAGHRALGRGGGAAPDRARGRRGVPGRASARGRLTRRRLNERRARPYLPARPVSLIPLAKLEGDVITAPIAAAASVGAAAAGDAMVNPAARCVWQHAVPRAEIILYAGLPVFPEDRVATL